jgi:hypothetical protein
MKWFSTVELQVEGKPSLLIAVKILILPLLGQVPLPNLALPSGLLSYMVGML